MEKTTIAAIATPVGVAGIGIIRISGPNSFNILNSIFIPKNNKVFKSHKLYYGRITCSNGETIDEVLATCMKAPKTYTKENIVEIQAHSGFVTLNKILSLVLKNGAVIAEPGEFTKRAFLNGRIDLTQAEGTIDLINAKTEKAAISAAKCVEGNTKIALKKLRLEIIKIQANYESMIEFDEKLNEKITRKNDSSIIRKQILPEIKSMLKKEKERVLYQEGVEVAIVGIPNVGKSSLMNILIMNDRSIVTNLPGTTRDVIKEDLIIRGLPVIIYDTAGICNTNNPIEKLGIDKSINMIKNTDIILLVIDANNYLDDIEKKILKKYKDKKLLVAINKIDSHILYQAFLNIFLTAIESMDKGGRINIKVQLDKENILVSIKDVGIGISVQVKDKIWDPFFTTKEKSTGLGLEIVKNLIESNYETVKIKNNKNKGACVLINLPICQDKY